MPWTPWSPRHPRRRALHEGVCCCVGLCCRCTPHMVRAGVGVAAVLACAVGAKSLELASHLSEGAWV
jgi:hypothetical protein